MNRRTIHILKIREPFLVAINNNDKTFEIRKNDRNYKVGDLIKFISIPNHSMTWDTVGIDCNTYTITYLLDDDTFLQKGYVSFSIKKYEGVLK